MLPFLGKARVVHDPSHDWTRVLHRRENVPAHLSQQCFVTPGSIGDYMMERLVGPSQVVGSQSGGHRLDTLPLTGKQQSLAIRLQRFDPIRVPCDLRQAIEVCRKAFLLWAWRRSCAHETILHQIVFIYNTVVLAGLWAAPQAASKQVSPATIVFARPNHRIP